MMQGGQALTFLLISIFSIRCTSAHLIDGVFTEPTLNPGYNLVTTVPKGAKALNVTELGNTSNILAVRRLDRVFVLNGNYAIARSGSFEAVGTTFTYTRQDSHHLESVAAEGPLQEPVEILIFYKEPNPGIVYRYVMFGDQPTSRHSRAKFGAATSKTSNVFPPKGLSRRRDFPSAKNRMAGDEARPPQSPTSQRRLRRRRFSWKSFGFTDCNKFCGGGVQVTRFVCVREQSQMQVPERRCHHLEKPVGQSIRCNTRPCPAKWRAGAWGECSVSCGDGFRSRELECVQEVTPVLTMRVADGACIEPRVLPVKEACSMSPCDKHEGKLPADDHPVPKPKWNAEPWSECSSSCGIGKRTRIVSCLTTPGRPCSIQDKPAPEEACNSGPCVTMPSTSAPIHSNAITTVGSSSKWLYTEWSRQCSADCGAGVQWRRVVCGSSVPETCDESMKPKTTQECSTEASCSGHWFTGPWTRCSAACEIGEQTREVVCVAKIRGSLHVALDMNCPVEKPEIKRHCRGPPCPAAWFASDWSECTRSCGKGMQHREVKCLESDGRVAEAGRECPEVDRPIIRRICNDHPCKNSAKDNYVGDGVNRVVHIQNDPEISNGLDENPGCKDTNSNCALVVQARLCNYKIYRRTCCLSCSKANRLESE